MPAHDTVKCGLSTTTHLQQAVVMQELLAKTLPLVALAFLATSMFNVGLDLTVRQIAEPLRNRSLLGRALVASVLLVPVLAAVLGRLLPMEQALATGLIVYGLAAGTEGGPKFVQLARGNAGFAVGLLAMLLTITIVAMPMVLSLVVPDAHVDRGALLVKLLVAVAVPMGTGLLLRARRPALADRLSAVMHRVTLACSPSSSLKSFTSTSMRCWRCSPARCWRRCCTSSWPSSSVIRSGGPLPENRRALTIMTCVRNAPISMTTASQVFPDEPGVLVMVTVMAALSVVYAVVTVLALRRFAS